MELETSWSADESEFSISFMEETARDSLWRYTEPERATPELLECLLVIDWPLMEAEYLRLCTLSRLLLFWGVSGRLVDDEAVDAMLERDRDWMLLWRLTLFFGVLGLANPS
jgi:hypothetical protein